MPKKSKDLTYNSKGINIVIKNDIKPYEEPIKPKPKQRRKRRNLKNTTTNNNFLDKNNNQVVDSKIPIYRDLYNRNINNIPQPQMVDWQAVRLGLLPPPPQPPALPAPPPPPTQTPPMIAPNSYTNNFPAITYPDPINSMARLMDSMRPYFVTNNPYNFEDGYNTDSYGRGVNIVELSPEDAQIQQEAEKLAQEKVLDDTVDEEPLDEEDIKKLKDREKYLELQNKIAGFGTGKLKQGASKSAGAFNAPAYIFNEEYMTRYNEKLNEMKADIEDELNNKKAQITMKTQAIKLEGDDVNKEKLKKEKKQIQQEIILINKRLDKIRKIELRIAEETNRYNELFPAPP